MYDRKKLEDICERLADPKEYMGGRVPRIAEDAMNLILHMERNVEDLVLVAPTFPELIARTKKQINDTKQPGEDPVESFEVSVPSGMDEKQLVPHEKVPVGSKPYMEVLRLLAARLRRENPF
jgi:hypothetical protein